MKIFDYENLAQDLFVPEIVNLISEIHEHKGKQELYIASEPDILKSMLEIARIQSTGASNRIEGIYTSDKRLEELVGAKIDLISLGRKREETIQVGKKTKWF